MKRNFLMLVALVLSASAYSQFYVSLSGGYGFEAGEKTLVEGADLKGSYGAGIQTQLRGGYFFNNTIGAELALGYLHGKEILTNKTAIVEMNGKGRAFGASLSAVVNITKNIYARAGAVTKVGGRTEVETKLNIPANPAAPSPSIEADFKTHFHGKIPFGFIGGLGYKHKLTDRVSIFGEVEYLAINVARKESKVQDYSVKINGAEVPKGTFINVLKTSGNERLQQLAFTLEDTHDWSNSNSPDAPYSSWGFHVGLTYHFKK